MTFNHCIKESGLSKEQAKELQKQIERRVKDGDFSKAGADIAEQEIIKKQIAKRNAALNLQKRIEIYDYVTRVWADKPELGMQAVLVGTNRARKGSRNSVASLQNSKAQGYAQGFLADVEKTGHWPEFVSGAYDDEIAQAMWMAGRGEDISKFSSVAKSIALVMEKWNEFSRAEANKAGAWIAKQDGYIVRQSHDMMKIRNAQKRAGGEVSFKEADNYKAWRDNILELLDTDRTFADVDDAEEFLKSTWEALASGVHMMHAGDGDSVSVPAGFASLGKRMSHDRVLHFKDGISWSKYNKMFGAGSLRESMLYGLERSAKNTAIMEGLGPNPQMTVDRLWQDLQKKTEGAKGRENFSNKRADIDKWMGEIDGSINIPANAMVARAGAVTRAIQSMAKLGGAVITSLTDIPQIASEMKYQGGSFLSGYGAALGGLFSGKTKEKKQIAAMLGVSMRGMMGNIVHRFSAQDDLGGKMSSLMRTYFKYNGLTWWTDSLRFGASLGFSRNLASKVGKEFGKLGEDLTRVLNLYAIDDGMWDMMRKVELDKADGEKFFTPEMARKISDAELGKYLSSRGFEATPARISNLKVEIEKKFRNYFVDRTEYAVIEPDARVRAASKRGTRPGTAEGETMRFIMQFKSFPMAVFLKPLARDIWGRGIEEDNFAKALFKAMRSGNGEMLALSHMIVATSVMGYVAMSAKDVLKGRTPRDPTDPKTILAAMAQGGGFGIYGDFVFGDYNRFGRSFLSSLAGPTIGQIDDVADLWSRIKRGDDVAASSFRLAVNNTPFVNLFYTRIILDYLILYRIQESMNPGYLRRMEKRIKEQNAQEFLIRPSSAAR